MEHVPRVYTDTIAKCKEYLVGAFHVDLDQIIYYIKDINSENSSRKIKQKGRGGSEEVDWFDEHACDVLWIEKKIEQERVREKIALTQLPLQTRSSQIPSGSFLPSVGKRKVRPSIISWRVGYSRQ